MFFKHERNTRRPTGNYDDTLNRMNQPTNHLDLESIQSFNEGCQNFPGIVLMTSHDHTFMQTVANRVIELTPKGVIDRLMTFDEYMEDKRVQELRAEMYS